MRQETKGGRWSSLMDKFQTERSKASSSSTQSESSNTERYHYYNGIDKIDRPPSMPLQFQVKLIVDVVYPATGYEKILCLYHYDYVNQRTREDLYKIKDNKHAQRYFTSIKKYDEGKKWMVFHRVRDGLLPNPTGCMVVVIKDEMFHPSLMHYHGIYVGEKNVSVYKNLRFETHQNVPTNKWAMKYKKKWYGYYETNITRKPVRLEWNNFNASVIHLEEGAHTVAPNVFDIETVTSVECEPFATPL